MGVASCPHCGHESGEDVCPLCGSPMAPPEAADAGDGGRARGRPVAWEDPGTGFPADAWKTWRESLFEPSAFFRRIDPDGPLSRPVLYVLLVSVLGAFFHLLWQAYLYVPLTAGGGTYGGGTYLVQFFTTPFVVLLGVGVQALILHLFVLLLAPRRRGLGSTARVVCYAWGPVLLLAVPFVGGLAGYVWTVVLQVVGIREAHRTTTGRAVAVVLAPVVLAFGAGLLLAVLITLSVGRGELVSDALLPLLLAGP